MTQRASTETDHAARIARVRHYLEEHLDDAIDPPELARRAHLSLHHFHRVFRGVVGESVAEHVRRLRLERAARRLRASDDPVISVALDAGYDAHEAFTRAFRARFGASPSEWRATADARFERALARDDAPVPRVTLARFEPVDVLAVRSVGAYSGVGRAFDTLMRFVARRLPGPATLYGLCPDDPEITPEANLRFDACVAVAKGTRGEGPVFETTVPGGLYATLVHPGPCSALSEAYLALIGRWAPTTRWTLADEPVVEHYLDGADAPEGERRTEIRVRLIDG